MSIVKDPNHPVMVSQSHYQEIEKVLESTPEYGKPRSGLYYVIPAVVMDSKKIEPLGKLLYALISGLADERGMCYPSDGYLSERLGVSNRQVQNLLQQIENLGLIRRETHRSKLNMFLKKRKIFVLLDFKKCLPDEHPCQTVHAPPCSTGHAQACDMHTNTRANIESEVLNIESEAPLPPNPELVPTKEEEEELLVRLKERPKESPKIKNMKAWKQTVLQDIRNVVQEEKKSTKITEKHKKQAQKYDMKLHKHGRVYACSDYVEFVDGSHMIRIRYDVSDNEWEEKTGWE